MKIALDPCLLRRVPLADLPALAADLGHLPRAVARKDFL
jgi:hypothetical protein